MATTEKPPISSLRHPHYIVNQENWDKWRLTALGGSRFLKRYMKKSSKRENDQDFRDRLAVSYVPAFAKAAMNEVKNSIFQRVTDVTREGGPESYQQAVQGLEQGVDLAGSTMNAFIGREILPELLSMSRVGVYVDMPPVPGVTIADRLGKRPYLYWYKAEDIRSWCFFEKNEGDPTEFKALLLRETKYEMDRHWSELPADTTDGYRYMWIGEDGYVYCQFYHSNGDPIYPTGASTPVIKLNIKKIPFVLFELSDSVLADTADYQIALMNLASTDMAFALKANFPFYTEQEDWRVKSPYTKSADTQANTETSVTQPEGFFGAGVVSVTTTQEPTREVRVGVASGRTYPKDVERPGFIHPSPEPMQVSMEKQKQLKEEIRQLVALSVANLTPRQASAESKGLDNQGLEAGLSYIGLELEHGERKIAYFWALYEGKGPATVIYPTQYSLLTDADRREIAKDLNELMPQVNSLTFRKEVAKQIVLIVLGTKVSTETLKAMLTEIDESPVIVSDPKAVEIDVKSGLVSLDTASRARGYPKGEVEKAAKDHAERLARIAKSQAEAKGASDPGARGVSDLSANANAGKEEKAASQKDQTQRESVKDRTRGKHDLRQSRPDHR
jgi:hypothetical protein